MKTFERDLADLLPKVLGSDPSHLCLAQYQDDEDMDSWTRGEVLSRAQVLADALDTAGAWAREPILIIPVVGGECQAAILIASCLLLGCPPLVLPALGEGLVANSKLMSRVARLSHSRMALIASTDSQTVKSAMLSIANTNPNIQTVGLSDLMDGRVRINNRPHDNLIERCHALQLTSGSTGENRICVWHAPSMISGIQGVIEGMGLVPDDRLFSFSGLHHTLGLLNFLFVGLFGGYPAIFMSPRSFAKDPISWLKGLEASQATVTATSNFALRQVVKQLTPETAQSLSLGHVRSIWNSGERVMAPCMAAFQQALKPAGLKPQTLRANYGLAESTGGAIFCRHDQPIKIERIDADALQRQGIAIPCGAETRGVEVAGLGRPWAGSSVLVRNRDGKAMPDGHIGEVALRTPSRLDRYLNEDAATDAAFEGDLLLTGDLAYLRDGELFWVARQKSQIVVRGRNIDPDEFTQVLADIDGIDPQRFVAFGTADQAIGTERVILAVELRDLLQEASSLRSIRRNSAKMIGIVPDEIIILPPQTIETTISGKRRHAHYRAMFESGGTAAIKATTKQSI